MNGRHALVISLFLAVAVVLGMVATVRTTQLGASASPALSARQVARRTAQLDAVQAKLRKAAARRPPALPPLPPKPKAQTVAAAAPRVVYVRPAPVVKVVHRSHGEHEGGREGGHEGGEGGGFDD